MNHRNSLPPGASEPGPLDLHRLAKWHSGAAVTGLALNSHAVPTLMRSLQSIEAVNSVLIAASDADALRVSQSMHCGLLAAVEQLTRRMSGALEDADGQARRQRGS